MQAAWLGGVRVVAITDRRVMGDGSVVAFGDAVARAVASLPIGAVLVQVREPELDGGRLLQLVHASMASGAPVMVHDRIDIALAAGAAGAVLPEAGLAIADARKLAPDGFWIGQALRELAPPADDRIDAAIAHYLDRLRASPHDLRVWLNIGDLYAKTRAIPHAVAVYRKVADVYRADGFWLKAIAVYKQILGLEPALVQVRLQLADLYRKLGLPSDAELYERDVEAAAAPSPQIAALDADLVQLDARGLRAARLVLDAHAAFAAWRTPGRGRAHLVAAGGITSAGIAAECRAAGADAVAAAWPSDFAALA